MNFTARRRLRRVVMGLSHNVLGVCFKGHVYFIGFGKRHGACQWCD